MPLAPSDAARRPRAPFALGTFVVLAVAVCAVYWRAIDAPLIFDDVPAIVENPSIVRLWPPIGDAERRGPLNPPGLSPTARRPLANLTFALNYRFNRLDPAGYRAVNLLIHVLAATMLAVIVRRTLLLPYFGWDIAAGPLALVAALMWAMHPLVTETVVYVTQRTELMVALFYLVTLWAALRYFAARSARARAGWIAVATLACLAGIASKEVIVSAPLVVMLYERTFLAGARRETRRSWPLYAGLLSSWVLLLALNASGVSGLADVRHRVSAPVWWMTQAKVLLLYGKLAIWPWPLSIHYAPTYLRDLGAAWPWLAAFVALTVVTVALVGRHPAARFVVVAVALILAPTCAVPLPKMIAAERRMYLPLAGLVTLAVIGSYWWLSVRRPLVSGRAFAAAATVAILIAGAVSVIRLEAYESAESIWRDAVRQQPDDPMAHYNLGVALLQDGRPPAEAMAQFEQTLRLDPEHTGALDNLGMILQRLGRTQDAMTRFEQALRIDPNDAVAHNNMGALLTTSNRSEEALRHLRLALALQPDAPKAEVHRNLGQALLGTGHTDEGIAHLEEAARSAPDDPDAQYVLGAAYLRLGRAREALPHLERARRLKPADAGVHNDLGAALLAVGQTAEAIAEWEQALRSDPDRPNTHYNLAAALLSAGRPRDAIPHCEQAFRLDPDDAQARFQCATAYARVGETGKASALAKDALATARSRGDTALAGEIERWLADSDLPPR